MNTLTFLLLTVLMLLFPGARLEGRREDTGGNPLKGRPDALAAGQELFTSMCSGCHGAEAEGGRGPNLEDGQILRLKGDHHLFDSIRKGMEGGDMPPFDLPDDQVWQLLAFIRSLSAPAAESQISGDPVAGRAVYFGKTNCNRCHMILGEGGFMGPDLSNIGMSRSWKQLRRALLDPNSRTREGYQGVTVLTLAGARITGILKDQTNYSAVVQDAAGNLHLLWARDIRQITLRSGSLMSDDYRRRLTPTEIDDLLAFLSRQSVRPETPQSPSPDQPKGQK